MHFYHNILELIGNLSFWEKNMICRPIEKMEIIIKMFVRESNCLEEILRILILGVLYASSEMQSHIYIRQKIVDYTMILLEIAK